MKKLTVLLTAMLALSMACAVPAKAESTKRTEEINIRDPFVLLYDGMYYMYGTGCASNGYGCWKSSDLKNWEGPYKVFNFGENSDNGGCNWAPECHYHNGKFYLFATYLSKSTGKRGVSVFRADSPLGPFTEISDGHITPKEHDAIDGTLYIDDEGQPWMVYVNEWTSNEDEIGDMAVAKLSSDFTRFISEPKIIFRADDGLWAKSHVTDGPFLYRTQDGNLIMLWSNFTRSDGYAVGIAHCRGTSPDGSWVHEAEALYKRNRVNEYDGGHGMLFRDKDGRLLMAIHCPNSQSDGVFEHAEFIELEDTGHTLVQKVERNNAFVDFIVSVFRAIRNAFLKLYNIKIFS